MTSNTNLSVTVGLFDIFVRIWHSPNPLVVHRLVGLMTLVGKLVHVDELTDEVIEGGLDEISLLCSIKV
jgi:hypothetical protein